MSILNSSWLTCACRFSLILCGGSVYERVIDSAHIDTILLNFSPQTVKKSLNCMLRGGIWTKQDILYISQ